MDLIRCGSNNLEDKTPLTKTVTPSCGGSFISTGTNVIPEVNVGLLGMNSHSVVVARGPHGFGFTVFGSSPVQIGRLEDGSPASDAGLKRYDCIVRINGQNVSRSTAESVARIVRESENAIGLEIQRLRTRDSDDKTTQSKAFSSKISATYPVACTSIGGILAGHLPRPQCLKAFGSQEFPRMGLKSKRPAVTDYDRIQALDLDQISVTSSEFSDSCGSPWRASSDETLVTVDSADERRGRGRSGSFNLRRREIDGVRGIVGRGGEVNEVNSDSGYGDRLKIKFQPLDKGPLRIQGDEYQLQWTSVRKLISYEEDFVYQMQLGVRVYLKPLRQKQSILSTDEHRGLFQNLEEILSLSETQLCQLHAHRNLNPNESSSDVDTDADTDVDEFRPAVPIAVLSAVYLAKIESFCETYEKYCDGIRDAFHLLVAFKKTTDLEQFLNRASVDCAKLTVSTFLQKPIEHIKDLVLSFQKVLCYTPQNTSGYDGLKQLVKALRSCCYRINENNSLRCGSSLSVVSSSFSTESGAKSSLSPSSSSSSSPSVATSIVSSIDTEVLDIQGRLLFPEHVPCFQLATANHHMIYSGMLKLIDETGCTLPLFLVLMSDLILLTRPDPDGEALHVLEQPIVLHDVVGCNFSCSHTCDFMLFVETPLKSLQRSWEPRILRMRAPSGELKCTWKNILEQRILTCKTHREITISNRRLDNLV